MPHRMKFKAEDYPDSAFARGLSHVSRLRFEPALEARFLAHHLARVRSRVRIWLFVPCILSIVYTITATLQFGIWSSAFWVHAAGVVPCILILTGLAWSPCYQRFYLPIARVLIPWFGILIATFVAQASVDARDEQLAGLTFSVIAVCIFSGLLLRSALVAAAGIIASFAVTSMAVKLQAPVEILKSVLVLTTAGIASVLVARDMERSTREKFLESGLLAELTTHDGLTGLSNRRAFDEHLLRVWQQAQRDKRTLALLMLDVDHFKIFNDTYGHQAGDRALHAIGRLLRDFVRRPLDMAARYGGEEFALILYDLPAASVENIAERIRSTVQAEPLPVGNGTKSVTISIGMGIMAPTLGRTPQGALQLADEALYEAKAQGRNRILLKGVEEYRRLTTGSFKTLR